MSHLFLLFIPTCSSIYFMLKSIIQCTMHSCDEKTSPCWTRNVYGRARYSEAKLTETTPWSTYSPSELYITLHNGDAFGVYCTQISKSEAVLEEKRKAKKLRTRLQRDGRGRLPLPLARLIWQKPANANRSRLSDNSCLSSYPMRSREPMYSTRDVGVRWDRETQCSGVQREKRGVCGGEGRCCAGTCGFRGARGCRDGTDVSCAGQAAHWHPKGLEEVR